MEKEDKLYFISSVRLSREHGFGHEPDRYVADTLEEIMQKETEYFGEGEFAAVRDGRLMMYPYEEGRWKIIGSVSSASTPRMITSKNACIWEKLPSYNSFSEEYLKEKTAEYKVRKNGNKSN